MKYRIIVSIIMVFMVPLSSHSEPGISDFIDLINFLDRLEVFQRVKNTLISNPDPAADKLVVVLEEISKIYISLDNELASYLSLSLDENTTNNEFNRAQILSSPDEQVINAENNV